MVRDHVRLSKRTLLRLARFFSVMAYKRKLVRQMSTYEFIMWSHFTIFTNHTAFFSPNQWETRSFHWLSVMCSIGEVLGILQGCLPENYLVFNLCRCWRKAAQNMLLRTYFTACSLSASNLKNSCWQQRVAYITNGKLEGMGVWDKQRCFTMSRRNMTYM